MFDKSRLRLTLWYVGILAFILLLFGAVVVLSFRYTVVELQDRQLTAEAETRKGVVSGGGDVYTGGSDEFGWVVVGPGGRPLGLTTAGSDFGLPRPGLARQAARSGRDHETIERPDADVRVVSYPVEEAEEVVAVVQVAQSRAVVDDAVRSFVSDLVPIGIAALALAAVGGHLVSGRAMRPIREAFDRQRAFVADASHELKTPLTLIRADAEVLTRGHQDQGDRYLLDNLLVETDRMNAVLSDLLVLARLDAGKLALSREPFNLAEVLSESVDRFAARADVGGIRFEVETLGKLPARGDRERTRQILAALLDNALRHTPPGGTVAVTGRRNGDRVTATVRDSGPGILPEDLPQVFDRFYRTGASRAKRDGTGLGLAIARDLARAQDGDLSAGNPEGAGAAFHLSLPAASR
jgi:signal transduction histidine kinase